MIVVTGCDRRRRLARLRLLALALIGLVVGHDAVFLAETGVAEGLTGGLGHGYWLRFVLVALVLAGIPLAGAVLGSVRLWRSLHDRSAALLERDLVLATRVVADEPPSYVGEAIALSLRLLVIILVGFTVQENLEHLASGQGLPGLWVLSAPVNPLAVPVLGLVALVLGAAGAWFRITTARLERRLRAARLASLVGHPSSQHVPITWRRMAAEIARGRRSAGGLGLRAPPLVGRPA